MIGTAGIVQWASNRVTKRGKSPKPQDWLEAPPAELQACLRVYQESTLRGDVVEMFKKK